ncbi:MAG: glycosyltransferase [Cryobacterium sp.]|uniref:glycosyltransferase n=1 Tax=unclassified Cryobacterium TaxID=2649013 RepID=UPI001A1E44D3|nr:MULTISPECIES: glycosyltransferase [unclassified Cryobacterium]MCY7403278.1 glycosyltransferase [Cryobacterium sp.]MEC5153676.1 glycosyltransferase involved in cell wall biosynthesis [Cryobacterium sp. CAN_C3]
MSDSAGTYGERVRRPDIDFVTIVVPVRDEELLLPRCLTALTVAIDALKVVSQSDRPRVSVLLVLDRCTDLSARVAAHWADFARVEFDSGSVGVARRYGIRCALRQLKAAPAADRIWIASTDADSAVPPNWLVTQLALARNGSELVLGTVQPDDDVAAHELLRWEALHTIGEGHPHVHGANLGVRADRYLAAGEFAPVDRDEDVLLVARLRDLGVIEARTALIPVLTSGRRVGRAPAGFAGYLRSHIDTERLDTEVAQ